MRTMPHDEDVYQYDLTIQYGGPGLGGPSLRDILLSACIHGDDEALHDDAEMANEYASICDLFRLVFERNPTTLTITVSGAKRLHAACLSAWSYADQNNYGADDEPDADARDFGKYGKFMLQHLTSPWEALILPDDGSHGFTRVEKR
jgi:hypothetical protein